MTAAAPDSAPVASRPHPFFSPVRREGEFAFVSGQMPFDDQLRIVGDDVVEQTRVCLSRIESLLRAEGLGLGDVVKAMVWLRRVEDFAEFNRCYEAVFRAHTTLAPARSTVRADLMVPQALVEIEVIARVPRPR